MSKSNTFENDLLALIFHGTTISNLAENAATSPATNLYVALHTADPGEAGTQATNEISYTGYSRIAVARTVGGWTLSGNSVSPVAAIEFGEMTGGVGGTVTHASIGVEATGPSKILYSGALTPPLNVAVGVIPRIKNTSTITEE